jgi:hypothetical protein
MKTTAPQRPRSRCAELSDLVSLVESIEARSSEASALLAAIVAGTGHDVRSLIEARMKTARPGTASILEHVRRNAQARDTFIAQFGGLLSSQEVAQLAGSSAENKAQIAYRWRKQGLIFSVEHRGQTYFPALQFDATTGRPREVTHTLIKTLRKHYAGWALALWFAGANAWLEGKRPFDLLDSDPARVVAAARSELDAIDD